MKKELIFDNSNYRFGIVGEPVGYGFNVGDIVSVYYGGKIYTNVLVKEGEDVFQMGLASTELECLMNKYKLSKALSYELVTDEILQQYASLKIVEVNYVEMTKEEIESELGYKIKIINKK